MWFSEIITNAKKESASNHHLREPLEFWEGQPVTPIHHGPCIRPAYISRRTGVRNAESQAASNYRKLDFYPSVGGLFWRSLSNGPLQTKLSR